MSEVFACKISFKILIGGYPLKCISALFNSLKQVDLSLTNSMTVIALLLSFISILVSLLSIKKQFYDRFKLTVSMDKVRMGIYKYYSAKRYEVRFFAPITFTNISNSAGIVSGVRIKVCYRFLRIFHLSEIYQCDYELRDDYNNFTKEQYVCCGDQIEKIVDKSFESFCICKDQQLRKHYMFRMFWQDSLRMMKSFKIVLEVKTGNYLWKKYGECSGYLTQMKYDLFIRDGNTIEYKKHTRAIPFYYMIYGLKQKVISKIYEKK